MKLPFLDFWSGLIVNFGDYTYEPTLGHVSANQ